MQYLLDSSNCLAIQQRQTASNAPLSLTSLNAASSGFDDVSLFFLVGVDSFAATFNGVPDFLHGLDGVVDGLAGVVDGLDGVVDGLAGVVDGLAGVVDVTAADFETLLVSVAVSEALLTLVLSPISSTLLRIGCKREPESAVKLAKLLVRFRLVRDACRPAVCSALALGKLFAEEVRPLDAAQAGLGRFKSLRGDSGSRCNRTDGETGSASTFLVLFDGDDASFCCTALLLLWFSSKINQKTTPTT